jgi:hypothetical protein
MQIGPVEEGMAMAQQEVVENAKTEDVDGDNTKFRWYGVGSMALGSVLLGAFAAWPVYQAKTGASEISISHKMIIAGMIFLVFGFNVAVFGKQAMNWFPTGESDLKDIKLNQWLILGCSIVVACVLLYYFNGYLEELGYTETH